MPNRFKSNDSPVKAINETQALEYFSQTRPEMLPFVPSDAKKIIDIGCSEGKFGRTVRERNKAVVWGVEMNPRAAMEARKNLSKVFVGDIQIALKKIPKANFDCAIFNDVLEHLPYPEKVLEQIKDKLIPGGWIVCSIPNILHVSILKGMLIDRDWKYAPSGILDRTHLRFFTHKSLRRMFGNLGYSIEQIKGINPSRSKKFVLFNLLTLGLFQETQYQQYACVVRTPLLK